MFGEFFSAWFVSPGVHFQTAAWVIIAGWFGYTIHNSDSSDEEKAEKVKSASMIIIFTQFVIYANSIEGKVEIDLSLMLFFSMIAFFSRIFWNPALMVLIISAHSLLFRNRRLSSSLRSHCIVFVFNRHNSN